jgi:hypothetical protein
MVHFLGSALEALKVIAQGARDSLFDGCGFLWHTFFRGKVLEMLPITHCERRAEWRQRGRGRIVPNCGLAKEVPKSREASRAQKAQEVSTIGRAPSAKVTRFRRMNQTLA